MLNVNKFAMALAVMGTGSVLSACGAQNSAVHAKEVPAASGQGVAASCGASGNCGANKSAPTAASEPQASCGSKAGAGSKSGADASCGAKTTAVSGATATALPQDGAVAAPVKSEPGKDPSATKTGAKKHGKMAGAQGGCGQGSCA